MKSLSIILFLLSQLYTLSEASAHPGSGIVADRQGNIYIVDTRSGSNPTLILSSDFPVAVGPDGSLYYPWLQSGRVQIYRLLPSGETKVFKVLPPARSSTGEIRWRNGIVVTADGSVYYTEDRAVRRISASGDISDVISDLTLPGCGKVAGVYLHTEGDNRQEWVPRVKKVSPDGKVVTYTL